MDRRGRAGEDPEDVSRAGGGAGQHLGHECLIRINKRRWHLLLKDALPPKDKSIEMRFVRTILAFAIAMSLDAARWCVRIQPRNVVG